MHRSPAQHNGVDVERIWPAWIAGRAVGEGQLVEVRHPGDDSVVGRHIVPDADAVERAVAAAWAVRAQAAATSAVQRANALQHISQRLAERHEEVARLITAENGKPLRWSRVEVSRAVSTFRWAAEEARRFSGELQRLDTEPGAEGRIALVRRFPHGPVLAIAPFNFPLNLVAHKVAPAIAVGAPVIIKPAPSTPLSALLLGDLLAETDLPDGMWSVLPVGNDAAPGLVADPRLPVVSFTGSETVGFAIQRAVPDKHVVLELGGNAAAVVLADWSSEADIAWAAERIATFGVYQAGQSCISVQRVVVDRSVADRLLPALADAVRDTPDGSPWDDATVVGPMINVDAAERVEAWVAEAVEAGGRVLVGGERSGAAHPATLLADVPTTARVLTEEVFGPVLAVQVVDGLDEAIAVVNDSRFGLQAGVFTRDIQAAFRLHRELEVGGVVIGDVPSFRADQMPYGGVKASGVGREGVRSTMADLTHERVLVLTGVDL